ncbi:MAG: ABC transporter permease, partial [Myxococcota bacterium]|nr:ABC transporter permease [Myxococcota bacterium]
MGMYFLIAARNLVQARRRSLLLTAALGMVSMLLVLLLALSQGISDTMMRSATVLVAGHVNVAGFFKGKPEDAFPLVSEKTAVRESVEKLIG